MNSENLQATAQAIRESADKYDQRIFLRSCGSPACIAGWAAHLSGVNLDKVVNFLPIAKDFLDITWAEANYLFIGNPVGVWPEPYSTEFQDALTTVRRAKVAARLLEALAAGEVKLTG